MRAAVATDTGRSDGCPPPRVVRPIPDATGSRETGQGVAGRVAEQSQVPHEALLVLRGQRVQEEPLDVDRVDQADADCENAAVDGATVTRLAA